MGGKTATSTSQVTIPPEVLARYNAVNARAETAASRPFQSFGTTAADYVAQINPQQLEGFADINATAGSYQPYMEQATQATQAGMGPAYAGIENYMSPYIKNVADTTGAMMRQQQEQAQSGALGTAASSGAFGGDRAGIAAANLQQQNQMAYGKTMADIMNQGYTQALGASQADLARQLQGGAQMAGLGAQAQQLGLQGAKAKIAAGTLQQQTEQAGKNAMIDRFMQEQGYPFQVAQFLANIAMGTGALSGTTTTATTPRNWLGFADGGVVGPMSHSKTQVGMEGYVPGGVLPVGQLMVVDAPDDSRRGSTLSEILSLTKALSGMGAKNGGVIGDRHGYQTDGWVTERGPAGMPIPSRLPGLGAQPDETPEKRSVVLPGVSDRPEGLPSVPAIPVPAPGLHGWVTERGPAGMPIPSRLPGLGAQPEETPEKRSVVLPGVSDRPEGLPSVPAIPVPAPGLHGISSDQRPLPRPAGLVPTVEVGPTPLDFSGAKPVSLPTENLGSAAVNAVRGDTSASDYFDTHIIPKESGGRQFDANGKPLTSSAGAVGIAQIMPSTGPEAAKLAGLPWDENRFYNDPEYNRALGKAYFMEQYRTFGSLDKAAAAYNAGPGALASAMDRATALGGSYLDYLPAETQQYVAGGTGVAPAAPAEPDGKRYEDRNFLGRFMYDPQTNKLNRDSIMAILAGIGRAAEAPTISPLGAILSGVGAGADAYSALELARQQKTKGALENAQTFMRQYLQAQEMGYPGTPQEYAKGIGYMGPIVGGAGAGVSTSAGGPDRITSYNGVPLDPFGRGMSMPMTIYVKGVPVQIMAGQSYGYLKAMETKLTRDVALGVPGAAETLQQVQNSLASHNGQITLPDGSTTIDPSYESSAFGASATVRDVKRTEELALSLPESMRAAQEGSRRTAELTKALTMLPSTGDLSGVFAFIGRAGQQLGLNVPTNAAEGYDIASKIIAEEARNAVSDLAGSVDTSVLNGLVSQSTANPNMAPGAIEELLAIKSGISDYQLALSNALYEAQAADPNVNLAEVERNFVRNNKPEDFVNQRRPEFKGTIQRPAEPQGSVTPDTAPDGSTSVDALGRPIVKRNGKWELQ